MSTELERVVFERAPAGSSVPSRTWIMTGAGRPAIRCDCGILSEIRNHEVRPDGTVVGSIGCPGGCGFHVFGRLRDWRDEVRPPVDTPSRAGVDT